MKRGCKVLVIDQPELSSCSKVAAGIWNPVVFKRITKSWMADEVLSVMLDFYIEQEELLGTKLFSKRNILKLFTEQQEADLWLKKAAGDMQNVIEKTQYKNTSINGITISETGFSKVTQAGNLYLKIFLEKVRAYLISQNSYLNEAFNYSDVKTEDGITYKDHSAERIVFAEGYLIKHNPFFNGIPFKPAKGEVITVESADIELNNDIVNKNGFIMPVSPNVFKIGATYNWVDLTDLPTQNGLQELNDKAGKITSANYKVISHEAGVRPSVIDRRPVLGAHLSHKNMYVFNGLGTKGVMLAPYFALHLADHILNNSPLNNEVNVARFNQFFVN